VPSGSPPGVGQTFAGGTLLSNGTNSPVNHIGLNPLTTYYYKLFSFDGVNYSPGVTTDAKTHVIVDFGVDLSVVDNCTSPYPLVFGTAPSASSCFDPGLDVLAPPPPPLGAFDSRFVSCNEGLFTDFKSTNPDAERIWDVHFQPADGCGPVSLSWNPVELPSGGYFHLVDPFLGTLVNVNMRTTSNFTDAQDLRHLQIKYNYQFCSNFNIASGWNLVSLPIDVADPNYLSLFPNASPGTLYGYSSGYYSTQTINGCTGYWLKFESPEFVPVCGTDKIECVLNLIPGWNIIGGPNCNVPFSTVQDPGGIIIPGTLYGYASGYFTSNSIDATKAYWIKANTSGTITINCEDQSAGSGNNTTISEQSISEFTSIKITDADENHQTLYFNGELDENISLESFSMPPVPPVRGFDARLDSDYRLSESNEVTIFLQTENYPVVITLNNLREEYFLTEIINGIEIETHNVTDGEKIIILDSEVRILKISKQKSIPTQYSLEQNFPNPFNPSTTIKFSIPESAEVSLNIYNTLGQKITELINSKLESGWYSYEWNAMNHASGIYIYELRTDQFISVKKMILLK
jgi:hypothetical protein